MSTFFDQVYQLVRKVPAGKVTTYGDVAKQIENGELRIENYRGITPRMVGWALHANKDSNTPCHRVVTKQGRVALNFAFDGWREQKRRLESEGVGFADEMHVDLTQHLWAPSKINTNKYK